MFPASGYVAQATTMTQSMVPAVAAAAGVGTGGGTGTGGAGVDMVTPPPPGGFAVLTPDGNKLRWLLPADDRIALGLSSTGASITIGAGAGLTLADPGTAAGAAVSLVADGSRLRVKRVVSGDPKVTVTSLADRVVVGVDAAAFDAAVAAAVPALRDAAAATTGVSWVADGAAHRLLRVAAGPGLTAAADPARGVVTLAATGLLASETPAAGEASLVNTTTSGGTTTTTVRVLAGAGSVTVAGTAHAVTVTGPAAAGTATDGTTLFTADGRAVKRLRVGPGLTLADGASALTLDAAAAATPPLSDSLLTPPAGAAPVASLVDDGPLHRVRRLAGYAGALVAADAAHGTVLLLPPPQSTTVNPWNMITGAGQLDIDNDFEVSSPNIAGIDPKLKMSSIVYKAATTGGTGHSGSAMCMITNLPNISKTVAFGFEVDAVVVADTAASAGRTFNVDLLLPEGDDAGGTWDATTFHGTFTTPARPDIPLICPFTFTAPSPAVTCVTDGLVRPEFVAAGRRVPGIGLVMLRLSMTADLAASVHILGLRFTMFA